MNLEQLLEGRWEFVGSERFNDSQWVATYSFVAGMIWEFQTHLIGLKKRIGVIVEDSPARAQVKLNYTFDHEQKSLKIDTQADNMKLAPCDPQADIYEVIATDEADSIKLSILNEEGCPPPYFRYILHHID